mgnify:CR=1 FL=1
MRREERRQETERLNMIGNLIPVMKVRRSPRPHGAVRVCARFSLSYRRPLSLCFSVAPQVVGDMDNDTLDELLADDLQYGTGDLDGIFAMFYRSLYGMADTCTTPRRF